MPRFTAILPLLFTLASAPVSELSATPKKEKSTESGSATPKPKKPAATPKPKASATPKPKPKPASLPAPVESSNDDELAPLPRSAPVSDEAKGSAASPAEAKSSTTDAAAKKSDVVAQPGTEKMPVTKTAEKAPNASIEPEELVEFESQPPKVQQLIRSALALTKQNLTYAYGSADPAKGGMDCSGTIYYVLREQGFAAVPRDASGQYVWVRKSGGFFAVIGKSAESFEFSDMRPGDLMFWSGTYAVDRDPPVTHSMIYLGTEKRTKRRVMFGASDGRSYDGKSRWGVSVFDFKMPRAEEGGKGSKADFLGYARIPGLRDSGESSEQPEPAAPSPPSEVSNGSEASAPTKKQPSSKKVSPANSRKRKTTP